MSLAKNTLTMQHLCIIIFYKTHDLEIIQNMKVSCLTYNYKYKKHLFNGIILN